MKKTLLFLTVILNLLYSPDTNSQNVKGLYVDGFSTILGNAQREDSLLNYAQYNGFNYLALYDLWQVHTAHNLTTANTCTVLANFIQNAKQNYGITQVGAIGENFFVFNNVFKVYNQQHTNPLQKFDVFNVEFEFWNIGPVSPGNYYCTNYLQPNYSCDTAGAFAYYKKLIHQVDSLTNLTGIISETYVGWFNQGQAVTIANTVDRILLHDYINNYSSLYSYVQQRLQYIAARNSSTDVIIIFSAEPSFMGPWLSTHNTLTPFTDMQTALTNETGTWKQYINLKGLQWFAYSFMPYNVVTTGELVFDEKDFNFFPNPASDFLIINTKNAEQITIEIVNSLGQKIKMNRSQKNNETSLDLSAIEAGIYFISVRSGETKTTRKIIVNR
ncbi:MAG: T9SS type A sorting domain-containing protein [Bacteroidia bacterium]